MNLLEKTGTVFDHFLNFFNTLACGLVGFVTIIICIDVFLRQVLGQPTIWVTEISEYSLLWITFFGTAWLLREEGHIRIDLFYKFLNPRTVNTLEAIISILNALVCVVISWYGVEVVWDHFVRGVPSIEMLGIPRYLILWVIPLGSFLLFIQFLRRSRASLRRWKDKE